MPTAFPSTAFSQACPNCGTDGSVVGGLCAGCLAATAFGFDEPEPLLPEPSVARPERLGNYELLEEIGRGGMGVVYRARQLGMEREVALKVIPAGPLADPEFVARFRSEARLAGKLHHPNIVAIHEVGEADAHAYFSMDLVPGGTLARKIKEQGPYAPRAAAALALKMARALEHAHAASVLHRDLKPANILLDFEGEPHLADFGLAKSFDDVSLTLTAQSLGTPAWLAPEQVADVKNPTAATDVYGAGAILYFLLTGRPPFPGRTVAELLKQVQEVAPVSPRLLDNAIPKDLETITLRCLEKTRQRRFVSARELALELERFLAGQPILSRPVSVLTHAWRWAVRHKALASSLALLAIVIIGSTIALATLWLQATGAAASEKQQRQIATEELWNALLQTAKGQRQSGEAEAHSHALNTIRRAAAIKVTAGLRDEAIAALTLPELRQLGEIHHPDGASPSAPALALHPFLKLGCYESSPGELTVLRFGPPTVAQTLPEQSGGDTFSLGFTNGGRWVYRVHPAGLDLLEVGNGEPKSVKIPLKNPGSVVSTSVDDTLAACVSEQSFVILSLPAGEVRARVPSHGAPLAALSPRGNLLATAGDAAPTGVGLAPGGVVRIFQVANSAKDGVREIQLPLEVTCLTWSSDESMLVCGLTQGDIVVLDARNGREMTRLEGHESRPSQLRMLGNDRYLLSTSWDHTTRLWDVALGRLMLTWPRMGNFTLSQDERLFWIQESYSHVVECALTQSRLARLLLPLPTSAPHVADSCMVAFSADDRFLFTAGRVHSLAWDVSTGNCLGTGPASLCLMPLPNGRLLSSTEVGLVSMAFTQNATTPSPQGTFGDLQWEYPRVPMDHASLSANGQRVIAAVDPPGQMYGVRNQIEVWEGAKKISTWDSGAHFPTIATDAEGSIVATGGHQNCHLGLRSSKDGEPVILQAEDADLQSDFGMGVAMDAAGRQLATITPTHLRLWDLSTRTLRHRLPRNGAASSSAAAFSPDGKLLLTTGIDHELWLIDPQTGTRLAVLNLQLSVQPLTVAFSHDGTKVAANLSNRGVLVWNLKELQQELGKLGLEW